MLKKIIECEIYQLDAEISSLICNLYLYFLFFLGVLAKFLGVRYSRYSVLMNKRSKRVLLVDWVKDYLKTRKFTKTKRYYLWYWDEHKAIRFYWVAPVLTKEEWMSLLKEKHKELINCGKKKMRKL